MLLHEEIYRADGPVAFDSEVFELFIPGPIIVAEDGTCIAELGDLKDMFHFGWRDGWNNTVSGAGNDETSDSVSRIVQRDEQ